MAYLLINTYNSRASSLILSFLLLGSPNNHKKPYNTVALSVVTVFDKAGVGLLVKYRKKTCRTSQCFRGKPGRKWGEDLIEAPITPGYSPESDIRTFEVDDHGGRPKILLATATSLLWCQFSRVPPTT